MARPAPQCPTIPALFWDAVAARGDAEALGAIRGGQLSWRSWSELGGLVQRLAGRLAELGVRAGDRVVQVSPNCEDWIVADLAIQAAHGVHVPLHATLAVPQMREQIAHCGATVVLVEDRRLAAELGAVSGGKARVAVLADLASGESSHPEVPRGVRIEIGSGRADSSADLGVTGAAVSPDDLATILYTSGTTGAPRGVMLTQRNLAANAIATTDQIGPRPDETRLCLLPLSHIYARTCDLYSWIYHGGRFVLAESRETVFRDCAAARPTAINAVPYFYQKAVDELRNRDGARAQTAGINLAARSTLRRCANCWGAHSSNAIAAERRWHRKWIDSLPSGGCRFCAVTV